MVDFYITDWPTQYKVEGSAISKAKFPFQQMELINIFVGKQHFLLQYFSESLAV